MWIPTAIIAIFTVKGLASYLQEVSLTRIGNRLVARRNSASSTMCCRWTWVSFSATPSNDLIARITHNANAARDMLNIVAVSFGRDALTVIGLAIVMVSQDPIMSAICLVNGPFIAIALRKLSERIREVMQSQYFSISTIVGAMRETAQGIRIIKDFQLADHQRQRMQQGISAVERMGNKIVAVQERPDRGCGRAGDRATRAGATSPSAIRPRSSSPSSPHS